MTRRPSWVRGEAALCLQPQYGPGPGWAAARPGPGGLQLLGAARHRAEMEAGFEDEAVEEADLEDEVLEDGLLEAADLQDGGGAAAACLVVAGCCARYQAGTHSSSVLACTRAARLLSGAPSWFSGTCVRSSVTRDSYKSFQIIKSMQYTVIITSSNNTTFFEWTRVLLHASLGPVENI